MSDENTVSNVRINGTTYALNDSTKASIEDISNLTNITNENNTLLSGINSKLDELLNKVGNSETTDTNSNFLNHEFFVCEKVIRDGYSVAEVYYITGCKHTGLNRVLCI